MPREQDLLALYRTTTSTTTWSKNQNDREDFRLVAEEILSHGCRSVLEVGCFDGGLSAIVKKRASDGVINWYGVEPSPAAAQVAMERGVEIVGESIYDVNSAARSFDAVVAVDVFEHLVDPRGFFITATKLLRPFGILVITTGSIDVIPRPFQATWHYVAMPEHMCFMSQDVARHFCRNENMKLITYRNFRHNVPSVMQRFRVAMVSIVSWTLRVLPRQLVPRRLRRLRGTGWITTSQLDHCLVSWQKQAAFGSDG